MSDDLIELARKHGGVESTSVGFTPDTLAEFAAAIRAQERERCAALLDAMEERSVGDEATAIAGSAAAIRSME